MEKEKKKREKRGYAPLKGGEKKSHFIRLGRRKKGRREMKSLIMDLKKG